MKKDKAWLIKRVENYIPLNDKTVGHVVDNILDIICQLDEPDVLSQEWISDNAVVGQCPDGMGYVVPANKLQNLIIPKQELPVIPQFVADWWERDGDSVTMYGGESIDKNRKVHLISNFNDRGLIDSLSKVEVWIDENESTFLDLVNGKPYEVEKEKLYYVLDKQGKTLLMLMGGEVCTSGGYALSESTFTKDIYQLTEKQIKDYDPRYWSFAVEVAE